jgi:hypothetical protein
MDGFHVEGVAQDKGNAWVRTEVGEPIPGADALDGHHQAIMIGRNGLEKGFRRRLHIAMHQDFPLLAHDADIHGAGMQVDPTVKWVLVGVESHEVSSFLRNLAFSQHQHTTAVG